MTDEPSAADEIMDGVYRALCTHGYAGVTMQDIADECSKSKSLLHYHYDTKEDLLVAFLDHILADFEEKVEETADDPPLVRLTTLLDRFVFDPSESERESFHIALLELRSQGPFNERIREQLDRSDRLLRETLADIIGEGIEAGQIRDIEPERLAALITAAIDGARTRQITLSEDVLGDDTYTCVTSREVRRRIVEPVLTEEASLPPVEKTAAGRDDADETTNGVTASDGSESPSGTADHPDGDWTE
ncbi:TetR/AcrR family transcriptional regulator [Haloparvum sedimenti]|uniref:TetR/AcrR family transcriptional regulator n=1 Tax=Haloparvum sedimenti TaxID=1678448 RepID=UPI0009B5A977|nr:TetR/AcrR family transcriptional regulator [Haloparvum sedimenti]